MTENNKIPSLTGLRFIMAMVIVLSHFEFLASSPEFGGIYSKYLHNSSFAVNFFFLLSGFGMMLGNFRKIPNSDLTRPKLSECFLYGIKHVRKIYPVYISIIGLVLLSHLAVAVIKSKEMYSFFITESLKLLLNICLLQSLSGMTYFTHAYNGVTWFLSSLFCIYLVSPFCIYVLRKFSKSFFLNVISFIFNLFLILVLSYLFRIIEVQTETMGSNLPPIDYLVYSSPFLRLFYVLIGMNTAIMYLYFAEKINTISFRIATFYEVVFIFFIFIYTAVIKNFFFDKVFEYKIIIDVLICASFLLLYACNRGGGVMFIRKTFLPEMGKSCDVYLPYTLSNTDVFS